MKKIITISWLLIVLSSSLVFAQNERKGTVIGTFGIGGGFGTIVETTGHFSGILDLNFISKTGFTLCLANIITVRPGALGPSQNIMVGAGYTFIRDRWNIGGAIIASPTSQDILLAGKINGSYYFTEDIGVTGIITYRQSGIVSDMAMSMFDVFAGISIKIF